VGPSQNAEVSAATLAGRIIAALGLQPHPIEGGFFRETYRSSAVIPAAALPGAYRQGTGRSIGTAIYYLLTAETFSELHRLPTDEVFHLYLGGPVRMLQLFPDGTGGEILIGSDILAGHRPQVVVPPGVWQGSCLEPGVAFALLGATMAPGFDYADYEQGRREELMAQFPDHVELIRRLTRADQFKA
jgi:predicted cupin superfamily sugar epimerase